MKTRITIHGTLRGNLWWGGEAEKEFTYTVKDGSHFTDGKRESLRDAVLRITNDGDFQSCEILADAYIKATLQKGHTTRAIKFDLNSDLFPSIKDCLLDDYPMCIGG